MPCRLTIRADENGKQTGFATRLIVFDLPATTSLMRMALVMTATSASEDLLAASPVFFLKRNHGDSTLEGPLQA